MSLKRCYKVVIDGLNREYSSEGKTRENRSLVLLEEDEGTADNDILLKVKEDEESHSN